VKAVRRHGPFSMKRRIGVFLTTGSDERAADRQEGATVSAHRLHDLGPGATSYGRARPAVTAPGGAVAAARTPVYPPASPVTSPTSAPTATSE
jgi:hypothetical protein